MKILFTFIAAGMLVIIAGPDASAAAKCTSIQARCAVQIGGECDMKTGRWQYGRWNNKFTGGNAMAFNNCVSAGLAAKRR